MPLVLVLLLFLLSCAPDPGIDVARIRAHQGVLASEAMEGRAPASEGSRKASKYLARRLKEWGYQPMGTDGSYFQPFGEGRRNVVGFRPGAGSDEVVAIGAHYDHLGLKDGVLHPGADDNASGSSVMLEVARAASASRFRRGVLCFWFDGEEEQLAGSTWWVAHPTLPLSRLTAMLNADMVGRNETEKLFCGVEKDAQGEPKWPKWEALARGVESRFGAAWNWTEFDPYLRRSDHWPFMAAGIPALFLTGGLHADYHQRGDRLEKINFAKEERVARIVYALLRDAADAPGPLK